MKRRHGIRYEVEMRFTPLSVVLSCKDLTMKRNYAIEIGPKPSADFFTSLLSEGLRLAKGVKFKPAIRPFRKDIGHLMCAVALFDDHGLIKCTAPATGESRNLEIYPRELAEFLGKALESRPDTEVEYEYLK